MTLYIAMYFINILLYLLNIHVNCLAKLKPITLFNKNRAYEDSFLLFSYAPCMITKKFIINL